jgi:prepilin-type N-terminal cleavage/methylation domain-containing protein
MRGFTLVEMMITLAIFSFIIASIFIVLGTAEQSWSASEGVLEVQQGLRQVMEGMVRECRQASRSQISVDSFQSKVVFSLSGVTGPISYYFINNQIIREHPAGTVRTLANNISALDFCCVGGANCLDCANAGILEIQAQAQKAVRNRTLNFSLTEQVKFRN